MVRLLALLALIALVGAGLYALGVADALQDRRTVRNAVSARGYAIAVLDRARDRRCGRGAKPYTFTAVRDGHLVFGAACLRAGVATDIATLAILR